MKKLLLGLLLALGVASCTSKPFTGRVVEKEYIAGHMCHTDGYAEKFQAGVIVPHVAVHTHHHSWQSATVTVWVANRYDLRSFSVDTLSYDNWVVGSKVTFK